MLDLNRFQNNFNVTIEGGLKMVHEWDSEKGEGNYVSSFDMKHYDESFIVSANNIEDIGKKILEHINRCNYTDFKESDLTICDNRILWNQIEDNDCNILETVADEKKTDKCYICDYDLLVFINGLELTEEELITILPKAN